MLYKQTHILGQSCSSHSVLTDFSTVKATVALAHFDTTASAKLAGAGKEGPKCDKSA